MKLLPGKRIAPTICMVLAGTLWLLPGRLAAQSTSTSSSSTQVSDKAKKEERKASKEAANAKKKAGLVSKLVKSLSAEAKQAKKLEKESKDSLQIFGWHDYRLDTAIDHYNFNDLSILSYYSSTMSLTDSTISYNTPRWTDRTTTQLITLARGDGCIVLLTLTCSDERTLSYLFQNQEAQNASIASLIQLIDSVQQVDGINIQFENLPASQSVGLTNYITKLAGSLTNKYLVLSLPRVDFGNQYDIKALQPFINQFILLGYDHQSTKTDKPGPLSPLEESDKWGPWSISRSVRDYLKAGVPKAKLIVALPFQGAVWRVDTLSTGKVRHTFMGHKHYGEISKKNKHKETYDSASHTMFGEYHDNGRTYHSFYENDKSLDAKIAWVKKQGLAGVAIWAMGYDQGKKELWNTIQKHADVVKLPTSSLEMNKITAAKEKEESKEDKKGGAAAELAEKVQVPTFLQKYEGIFFNPKVVLVSIVTLLIFLLLGVIKSLFYPEVYTRLMIADAKTYATVNLVFLLIFFSLMFTARLIFYDSLLAGEIEEFENVTTLYASVNRYLWIIGITIWLGIQAFSIKTFLKLNTDLP